MADDFISIKQDLEKIKYHIRLLSEMADHDRHPVESLILNMNWTEQQIERAHDIFEEYDKKIENGDQIKWLEFELKLRDEFGIGYQTVKLIILAFYKNSQWPRVCVGYAKSFEPGAPVEFHRIIKENSP